MAIKDNIKTIRANIEKACHRAKRNPAEVQILGVCKDQNVVKIKEAFASGIVLMGENKAQEAEAHMKELDELKIEWHFIGKLQKNKINKILATFNFIESVDGVKALEHIHKRVDQPVDVFIEINVGEEKTKSGFTIDGLRKALNYISHLNKVRITGLMALPPLTEDAEEMRPYFRQLRQLRDEINDKNLPNMHITQLSMGMSNDYDVAIEEGATIIRIGTALFGRRPA